MRTVLLFLLASVMCCSFAAPSIAAEPGELPMAAVPDDGVIRLTDYGYRDWGPQLVRYRIDTNRFRPGRLVLTGPNGAAVPFQIEGDVLCFVAALKKKQSVTYTLEASDGDRSAENSSLTHKAAGDAAEIQNSYLAIRVPKPQEKTFNPPAQADKVPPPIFGWKQEGFDWIGGARFLTERRVRSYEIKCISDGPASVAYEGRYRFAPKGEYLWRIRVSDGLKVAVVTEEFDFGETTEGRDFLMLSLDKKWQPEQIGRVADGTLKSQPSAEYLEQKTDEQNKAINNVSAYTPPMLDAPKKGMVLLEKLTPTGTWGPSGAIELRSTVKEGEQTLTQAISVCPWHTGAWRHMMAMIAWHDRADGIQLALPISVRLSRWYLEVTDDLSPFSTHEHEPDLPSSYGRRVWALGFGLDNIVDTRIDSGYIGLDRYKDWIIDWPEDEEKATYPRAFTTLELLGRIIDGLDKHPEKANLEKLYLLNGRKESAIANARSVLNGMQQPYNSSWRVFGLPGYLEVYFRLPWGVYAEDALSCPDLPAELRAELRLHLALWANFCAEPDFNPRPAGTHLGNPNMPIGRTTALVLFAALLPDHPMYEYWMNQMKEWAEFRLAINTSPGGAWFEPPTYKMYGPTRALTIAQILIRNGGFGDLAEKQYHARALEYDANLTMPDPRYKGWRILPGMGNSGNTLEGVWGMGAGVVEQADPAAAGLRAVMTFDYGNAPNYHHRAFNNELGLSDNGLGKEAKTTFRIKGRTDQGFFYVVYPRKDGEHDLVIRNLAFPKSWARQFKPGIAPQ